MQIHESHQMRPSSAGGIKIHACAGCGATDVPLNEQVMAKPCTGPGPSIQVIADENVIAIQWEFPETGIRQSEFPQPLITVDSALDGRPVQLVLVGPRAEELRLAASRRISGLATEFVIDVLAALDPETAKGVKSMASYERLAAEIKKIDDGKITFEGC